MGESPSWGVPWMEWQLIVGLVVVSLLVYEQLSYLVKGKQLPGPTLVVPLIGDVVPMVRNPTKFWNDQAFAAGKGGLSWNVLFGKFILFVRDSELSHRILTNVAPDGFQLIGHPFGKKLFGEFNLINMYGEEHRDLRRRLAPNFTLKALGVYVSIQERIIREHIAKWIDQSKRTRQPLKMRFFLREMNLETSQETFVGPYMSAKAREEFRREYYRFNAGSMTVPVDLPGFAYHKARRAVPRLVSILTDCARQSKLRMARGEEPSCLVDFWMAETVKEIQEAKAAGKSPPPHSSDSEVGSHLFDFLFAAQDASTSSLTWAVVLLEEYPQVLEKVREEQKRLRPDPLAPITPDQLREMEFTTMALKEVLRFRPPATLVPHIANKDFAITESYNIRKGTIVFPSVLESSFQGFTEPYKFDPERFSSQRQEDVLYRRNFLSFGAGPHQCIGQRYALNHLMVFIALLSTLVNWTRERTTGCDDLIYTPTISPKDDGLVWLSSRLECS